MLVMCWLVEQIQVKENFDHVQNTKYVTIKIIILEAVMWKSVRWNAFMLAGTVGFDALVSIPYILMQRSFNS
jgi:hypothetical protein